MDSLSHSPNVTVVMIFLNAETYIREAVESVLAQTYQDFELILVDDGSTDASTDIARNYACQYPDRVRYTEHKGHRNLGMSASRNHGVSVGCGQFVSFLDSDDIWLPTRLERFVAAIESCPEAAMVYGPTLYWYSWAKAPEMDDFPGALALLTDTLIPPPVPLRRFLETRGGCLPGIGSLIIRRGAYERIGGFEAAFRGLYEDQVFLSKMTATHPVVVIPDILDYYRQHSESCCQKGILTGDYNPKDLHPARGRYLAWLTQYCHEQAIADPPLLAALDRESRPYRSLWGRLAHRIQFTIPRVAREFLKRPIVKKVLRPVKRKIEGLRVRLRRLQLM